MSAESPLRDGNGPGYELIETLRWDPETGFVRLPLHRARLLRSAGALGFDVDAEVIDDMLTHIPPVAEPLRVRFTVTAAGDITLQAEKFSTLADDAVWRVAIAATRLSSDDALLAHKTTRREIYEAARAEFSAGEVDEVLLLNERGEVCEGCITSVFVDAGDGTLLTPPLSAGLLDGVLRRELIDAGRAVERLLVPEDLAGASALFVGNSLRGLIRARLVA